jgi:enoyl-CoA hydratase
LPPIDLESYTALKLSQVNAVLTITLSNPGKKNAYTPAMGRELDRVWREVDYDESVRVVVLTGEGDAFCAGLDLSYLSGTSDEAGSKSPKRGQIKGTRTRIYDMLDCETPIISKVRGPAFGLGVNLCLAADIVVAAENAVFCDSHVKNGIAAGDGGVALFPLLIGFHRAKEALMLGRRIGAQQAADMGLINHCVPDDELDTVVDGLATEICESAPLAVSWTKLAVNVLLKQLIVGGFETSVAYDMLSLGTDDVKEGATAFLEGKKPKFNGR